MKLRRGFKTEANAHARNMRQELGLCAHDPLCPWKLAIHLGYDIVKLSDYAACEPHAVAYLQSQCGTAEFSAVTIALSGAPFIIHNDSHHPWRQSSNLAHEAAHGLLCHKPAPLVGNNGARHYNKEQEDEATWLGAALLISEEAAMYIVQIGSAYPNIQTKYGVSQDLLMMRLRVTGAFIRNARRRVA